MSEALRTQDCANTLLKIESRLTALETEVKHMATKADIVGLRWIIIALMVAGSGANALFVRFLS